MMCDDRANDAILYLYGELPAEAEEQLEGHLDACAPCRDEIASLRAMGHALDARALEPSQAFLAECRVGLDRALDTAASPSAGWLGWRLPFGAFNRTVGGFRALAAAAALVAFGFIAARVGPLGTRPGLAPQLGKSGLDLPTLSSDSVISGIRPTSDGQIQIDFDRTDRGMISGRPDDERIQTLLLRAVRDQGDPGLRVDSITILKDHSSSELVRSALLQALLHDSNPGVRLKAIEGLRPFVREADVRSGLTAALLADTNSGVRIQAIDALTLERDDALVGVLQSIVQNDSNSYIRMRCKNTLREMNASVGAF